MQTVELILASSSPRRQALLQQIGYSFSIHPSHLQEPAFAGGDPARYACSLAAMKASEIAKRHPQSLVVGADTIVILGQTVLGKPADAVEARSMLSSLSNRSHQVITAYSIQLRGCDLETTRHVTTTVHFRQLQAEEIKTYIRTSDPFDKAGAYGIQDYSSIFVDRITGCFYNVVGFPLADFHTILQALLTQYQLTLRQV